jgi:5-methylcytosine-specific restriction endonuclease McrA
MDAFETSHLSHRALLLDLRTLKGSESRSTAIVLSRIGEVDARELYRQEGYPSMYEFLVHGLHYSDGAAYKRLHAARAAWKFPFLYQAVAEGKLHLSAVVMLARHLTEANVGDLVHAATHKTKAEIEQLIAERFPRRDWPERLQVMAPPPEWLAELSPGKADATPSPCPAPAVELSPGKVEAAPSPCVAPCPAPAAQLSPGKAAPPTPPSRITPLAPRRYGFQFTGDQETRELYEDVRALLSHQLPSGEMALVFKRALQLAKAELEKRKYAATDRPGRSRGSKSSRHIPASARREVHERDQGRCTFVSEAGKRCDSRHMVEFEHDVTRARGGESTPKNLRLLCRAHNQLMAEREFGTEFMDRKRAARGRRGPRHETNVRDAATGEPL